MLCVLLAAGAVAATYSLYLGGSKRQRVWAAEFQALCQFLLFLVLFTVDFPIELLRNAGWQPPWGAVGRHLAFGVLLPAVVLLDGALPFLAIKFRSYHPGAVLRRDEGKELNPGARKHL